MTKMTDQEKLALIEIIEAIEENEIISINACNKKITISYINIYDGGSLLEPNRCRVRSHRSEITS